MKLPQVVSAKSQGYRRSSSQAEREREKAHAQGWRRLVSLATFAPLEMPMSQTLECPARYYSSGLGGLTSTHSLAQVSATCTKPKQLLTCALRAQQSLGYETQTATAGE